MNRTFLRLLLLFFTSFVIASCGVGAYSVSSGKEDMSGICFTAKKRCGLTVEIDGHENSVRAIKVKAYKPGMKIKQTSKHTIRLSPGKHQIVVKKGNVEIFRKLVYLSTDEYKVINL